MSGLIHRGFKFEDFVGRKCGVGNTVLGSLTEGKISCLGHEWFEKARNGEHPARKDTRVSGKETHERFNSFSSIHHRAVHLELAANEVDIASIEIFEENENLIE